MSSLSWTNPSSHTPDDPRKGQPEGYGLPRMTDRVGHYWVCEKCGSSVGNAGVETHNAWHERIGF